MIGGNITALLQVKTVGEKNLIGEHDEKWIDCIEWKGWLDYQSGESNYTTYNAKIQETTHIFLCDFNAFRNLKAEWLWNPFNFETGIINTETQESVNLTAQNARLVVDGTIYQILLIDDPMGMHQHLEIYLKYVGGGIGV